VLNLAKLSGSKAERGMWYQTNPLTGKPDAAERCLASRMASYERRESEAKGT